MQSYDAIVIGAGVIGSSVACHLARFGARNVLVLERLQIGAGTTTQSSIQYYRDGRWLPWKSLIPTLRMFAIDSTGFERTVMVGIRGAMLEYFGEEPCTEVIPPVTPLAIGKLVRTDHALVMTYGDRGGFNDRIQVFIYWIDR